MNIRKVKYTKLLIKQRWHRNVYLFGIDDDINHWKVNDISVNNLRIEDNFGFSEARTN